MEHEMINVSKHSPIHLFETSIRYRANHFHFEHELILLLSGELVLTVEEKPYTMHKGDIAVFGKSQSHMLHADKENCVLVVQFNLEIMGLWFPQIEAFQQFNAIVPHDPQSKLWQTLEHDLLEIAAYHASHNLYRHLASLRAVAGIILAVVQHYQLPSGPSSKPRIPELTDERQKRIHRWISDHYRQDITLQQLAELEGVSTGYLSHYIRQNLGCTFTQFVTKLRTAQAAHLLESTDLSVLDVLLNSGFSDYRYMHKAFLESFHCTPKEYRAAARSQNMPHTTGRERTISPDVMQFTTTLAAYAPGFPEVFLDD